MEVVGCYLVYISFSTCIFLIQSPSTDLNWDNFAPKIVANVWRHCGCQNLGRKRAKGIQ